MRVWRGSQSRAFEELSFQLLKHDVPQGTTAVRTGNPDGGVEWYVTLADSTEWGWQAKHVHGIDDLLRAMAASVRRVVRDRPAIVKLTFVISSNLATSTQAGQRKSQRQKYDAAVVRWRLDIPGAQDLKFDLVQESDLLDRLSEPQHRGRKWFWWHQPVFTPAWLEDRLAEQTAAAGDKYRPDLQVDLPIQHELEALGFDASVVDELEGLRRRVSVEGRKLNLAPSGPAVLTSALRRVSASAHALSRAADGTILIAGARTESDRYFG